MLASAEAAIRPDDPHYPRTRAVAIENTHNRGGGKVWPLAAVRGGRGHGAARARALHGWLSFEGRRAAGLAPRLREAGVLCNPEGSRPDLVRFVRHLDVSASDIEEAARRIAAAVGA